MDIAVVLDDASNMEWFLPKTDAQLFTNFQGWEIDFCVSKGCNSWQNAPRINKHIEKSVYIYKRRLQMSNLEKQKRFIQ